MSLLFFINTSIFSDERIDMAKFMEFLDQDSGFNPLTSSLFKDIKALPLKGKYAIQKEESRPELVSNKVYGNTQYWWVIMIYNGLVNTDEVINGLVVKYPKLDSVEDLLFSLKASQVASST